MGQVLVLELMSPEINGIFANFKDFSQIDGKIKNGVHRIPSNITNQTLITFYIKK